MSAADVSVLDTPAVLREPIRAKCRIDIQVPVRLRFPATCGGDLSAPITLDCWSLTTEDAEQLADQLRDAVRAVRIMEGGR